LNFGFWISIAAATVARAQDAWVLTTADFRSERVSLRAMGDNGITIVGADNKARNLPLDRLLQIERIEPTRAAVTSGKFVLVLAGGDRLAGEPRGVESETLAWAAPSLGEMKLPLKSVVLMYRAGKSAPAPPAPDHPRGTEDVVTLGNGDTVRGIINTISDKSIAVQSADGNVSEVPMESVASIEFAAAAGTGAASNAVTQRAGRAFRVALADGSAVTAPSVRKLDENLVLTLDDRSTRTLPFAAVAAIEQVNGPVLWLSAIAPIENVQVPFLDYSAPARMNQSITGRPIRFGDRTYSRGIGAHSYSRITWPIDPSARAFRTQYAIDGDMPYANVTVRIKLDDRVAYEKSDVRAGALSPIVLLDVNHEKTITLEVDYGQTYDVQDRFNWIEPALLKVKPEPPAAPAPAPHEPPSSEPTTQSK
jgi:hypothetical protein